MDELTPDRRMEMEYDDDFRALRRRFYKLGRERRLKVLVILKLIPGIPERVIAQGEEKRLLFEAVQRDLFDNMEELIEIEEAELAEEKALKGAEG